MERYTRTMHLHLVWGMPCSLSIGGRHDKGRLYMRAIQGISVVSCSSSNSAIEESNDRGDNQNDAGGKKQQHLPDSPSSPFSMEPSLTPDSETMATVV